MDGPHTVGAAHTTDATPRANTAPSINTEAEMIGGGAVVRNSIPKHATASAAEDSRVADDTINQIRDALRGLQFGSVNIIVQDGVVIQIDRTEKKRLRANRNSA